MKVLHREISPLTKLGTGKNTSIYPIFEQISVKVEVTRTKRAHYRDIYMRTGIEKRPQR